MTNSLCILSPLPPVSSRWSPYVSCFPIHISFLSPLSSHCYCFWLLSPPSLQGQDPLSFAISLSTFPRWVLQRVLQREGVTELSSLHGMERKSSAAVSFGDFFSFFPFKNKCSVLLGRWANIVASKSVGNFSLAKLNIVRFQLPALSLDWLQPLPKSQQLWRNSQDRMACTQSLTLC